MFGGLYSYTPRVVGHMQQFCFYTILSLDLGLVLHIGRKFTFTPSLLINYSEVYLTNIHIEITHMYRNWKC